METSGRLTWHYIWKCLHWWLLSMCQILCLYQKVHNLPEISSYATGLWPEFWSQFCNFLVKCSVYIICPSVLSCSNLKLHQILEVKNIFKQENTMHRLTFNPGLTLTGFRTTRPRTIQGKYPGKVRELFVSRKNDVYLYTRNNDKKQDRLRQWRKKNPELVRAQKRRCYERKVWPRVPRTRQRKEKDGICLEFELSWPQLLKGWIAIALSTFRTTGGWEISENHYHRRHHHHHHHHCHHHRHHHHCHHHRHHHHCHHHRHHHHCHHHRHHHHCHYHRRHHHHHHCRHHHHHHHHCHHHRRRHHRHHHHCHHHRHHHHCHHHRHHHHCHYHRHHHHCHHHRRHHHCRRHHHHHHHLGNDQEKGLSVVFLLLWLWDRWRLAQRIGSNVSRTRSL